MDKIVI